MWRPGSEVAVNYLVPNFYLLTVMCSLKALRGDRTDGKAKGWKESLACSAVQMKVQGTGKGTGTGEVERSCERITPGGKIPSQIGDGSSGPGSPIIKCQFLFYSHSSLSSFCFLFKLG